MTHGLDINISIDVSQLVDWEVVPKATLKRAMQEASATYMENQRSLLRKGRDVSGASFREYTLDYWSKKKLAGRMGENYWLRLTGQLLRSQRVKVKQGKKFVQATISFEGMHTPSEFTNPYDKKAARRKKAKWERTKRSEAGAFEYAWGRSERVRRLERSTEAHRLTVNLSKGEKTPNAFIAWQNHRRRPFIGMSGKTMAKVWRSFAKVVKQG